MSDEFFPTFERHLLDVLEERNPGIDARLIERAKLTEAVQIVRQEGQTDREGMRRLLKATLPASTPSKLLTAISDCFNDAFSRTALELEARSRKEALDKQPLDDRYLQFEQFFLEALSRGRPMFRRRKKDQQTLDTFFRREKLKEIFDYWIDNRLDLGQDDLGRLLEDLGAVHTDGYILGSFHTTEDNRRFTTQAATAFRQAVQRMRVELHQQRLQGADAPNEDIANAAALRKHASDDRHNYHGPDFRPDSVATDPTDESPSQSDGPPRSTDRTKSPGKKRGPKGGPRKESIIRRSAIKVCKKDGLTGEEACKRLDDLGIPLPPGRTREIYDSWVQWFGINRKSFYSQWSADLKRP